MKVDFKYGIRTYSGTVDGMTYGSYKKGQICMSRRWIYPKPTDNNAELGSASKNLAAIWKEASDDYKDDFRTYANKFGNLKRNAKKLTPNAYSMYVKAMYAWAYTENPVLDLRGLSSDDIMVMGGKVASVASCVNNNLLPAVPGWEELDSVI